MTQPVATIEHWGILQVEPRAWVDSSPLHLTLPEKYPYTSGEVPKSLCGLPRQPGCFHFTNAMEQSPARAAMPRADRFALIVVQLGAIAVVLAAYPYKAFDL